MAVLTDRKEPEDYDKGSGSDEPNDYAIKYLFGLRRPAQELWRTGRTLIYCGAAASLLATAMLIVAVEFSLTWPLVLLGLAMLATSGLAAYRLWKNAGKPGTPWLSSLPLAVLVLGIGLSLSLDLKLSEGWVGFYYLPGALAMLFGALIVRIGRNKDS